MIRILVLTLLLSGCSTLERVSFIPDVEVQTHTTEYTITQDKSKIEENIIEADKTIIEVVEEKEEPTTASQPPNGWLLFLALILISIGITTLSLKEFNVKEKTTIGR